VNRPIALTLHLDGGAKGPGVYIGSETITQLIPLGMSHTRVMFIGPGYHLDVWETIETVAYEWEEATKRPAHLEVTSY
jgi:hypothetical protein